TGSTAMARSPRDPSYRKHSTGLGFAEYRGKRTYFKAQHNSPQSKRAYYKFFDEIATDEARSAASKRPGDDSLSIAELIEEHPTNLSAHAEVSKRKAFAYVYPALEPFAATEAKDFGPRLLKTVRKQMIEKNLARKTINT